MEYKIKLAAGLPKGELNGLTVEMSEELYQAMIEGRANTPRVALLIFDVKHAGVDKDGARGVTLAIRRVEPLLTTEHRRSAEAMLYDAYQQRTGAAMLPFELSQLSKETFVDLPKTHAEIDEKEESERENMTVTDELRMHLERVHGRTDAATMTAEEAEHRHQADHDGDLPGELQHDVEWIGWTRADIEAATAESDEQNSDDVERDDFGGEMVDPDAGKDLDDEDDQVSDNVRPLFSGTSDS